MEYRKESSQRTTNSQENLPPPSSTSTGLNVPVPGPTRDVLSYSIQTGEEFALEFMRDRAVSQMPLAHLPVPGLRAILDVSSISTLTTPTGNRIQNPPERSENRPVPASCPAQAMSGDTSSGSNRVIFFCSYGGEILLRQCDKEYKYVGGVTRIIRINYNISFEELKRITGSIYHRPHTIKFQLPGESLEFLISVTDDDDVRTMMEELGVRPDGSSASGGRNQNPRMFLFPEQVSSDPSPSQAPTGGDSDVQFPLEQ